MIPFTTKFEFEFKNGCNDTQKLIETICSKYRIEGFKMREQKESIRMSVPFERYIQSWRLFGMTDSFEIGLKLENDSLKLTYIFNATNWWLFSIVFSIFAALFTESVIIGIGALTIIGGLNYGIMTLKHHTHYIELKEKIKKTCYNNGYSQYG